MKNRLFILIMAAIVAMAFVGVAYAEDPAYSKPHVYTGKQTFRAGVDMDAKPLNFGEDGSITTDRRFIYPTNKISNSLLGVWSGGTRFGISSGGKTAVPDGWNIQGDRTGVTRVDAGDLPAGATGTTIYPGFPHALYLETRKVATGAGNTAYFTFPGENGVSTARTWYQQFLGKRVVFGAFVKRDLGQYVKTGTTTQFLRPFINTYANAGYLAGETSFAFGGYQNYNGWQMVSAVTTVPVGATALEVGFAMNPTTLAPVAATGDSAYVCAPFLLIDPVHDGYVPTPGEEIFFINQVGFDLNGNGLSKGSGTSSYSLAPRTEGKVPADVDAYYVSTQGQYNLNNLQVQFRTDTGHVTGNTLYPPSYGSATGTSIYTLTEWVRADYNGDFDLYTSGNVGGVSIYIKGVKMRK